jgi:hypothetical protein
MNEAIIILLNMRGGCATVGDKVHTLFRVNNRRPGASLASENKNSDREARLDQPYLESR